MSEVVGEVAEVGGNGDTRQALVTRREAAQFVGVSTKLVRRWIGEGKCHAEKGRSRYGETWYVDAANLPPRTPTSPGHGPGSHPGTTPVGPGQAEGLAVDAGGVEGTLRALLAMHRDLQTRYEAAMVRLCYLAG